MLSATSVLVFQLAALWRDSDSNVVPHVFGGIAFLREDTTMACYYASVNPDFCANVTRCLNQSRASSMLKSNPIAIKFGTAVASLMVAQYTFVFNIQT